MLFEELKMDQNFPVRFSKRKTGSSDTGYALHWHEAVEFYYVVSGSINIMLNNQSLWLKEGDVAFANWCNPHSTIAFLDNTFHYVIQIDLHNPIFSGIPAKAYLSFYHDEEISSCFQRIIEYYLRQKEGDSLKIIGEIYKIFGCMSAQSGPLPHTGTSKSLLLTLDILKYIHENYAKPLDFALLGRTLKLSESHMCRVFKQQTGLTISSYTNKLRFDKAVSLLKKGYDVSQVSEMVGFRDYNYFSRAFKKCMNHPPSYYKTAKGRLLK